MAGKKSRADFKMQELNERDLLSQRLKKHLLPPTPWKIPLIKLDESKQPLNRSTMAGKKSRADVKIQGRSPAFDEDDELLSIPCPVPKRVPKRASPTPRSLSPSPGYAAPGYADISDESDNEESPSTQFQGVRFTRNPVYKGGEPMTLHSIKQHRPKIVRNVVPTVSNPVLPAPSERPA